MATTREFLHTVDKGLFNFTSSVVVEIELKKYVRKGVTKTSADPRAGKFTQNEYSTVVFVNGKEDSGINTDSAKVAFDLLVKMNDIRKHLDLFKFL